VNKKPISAVMSDLGISGHPTRRRRKPNLLHEETLEDMVNRDFHPTRSQPALDDRHHRTSHSRGHGLLLLRFDAWSPRIVGWSLLRDLDHGDSRSTRRDTRLAGRIFE
jgi:hypothetical protein